MESAVLALYFLSLLSFSSAVIWFSEKFDDPNWEERWTYTTDEKYKGRFKLSSGKVSADKSDLGLRTMDDHSFYALTTKISRFSNRDKPLVIQLTVKHETKNMSQDDRLCAAVLLKLFPSTLNPKRMNGDSKHWIRYGPDFCGAGGRVRSDLYYNGKILEHKGQEWSRDFGDPFLYSPYPWCPQDGFTHLYTFVLFPNNTYEKRIDGKIEEYGGLEGAWDLLPPKHITLDGERPDDWDEVEFIVDPTDVKPADWEEEEFIPDPYATKPEDWDEEADGPWDHPIILNPKFQGEWTPSRFIKNPNYKGFWRADKVDNPEYKPDPQLYVYKDIAYLGIESWQEHSGTIIDNILLTDDLEGALKNGTEWQKKFFDAEQKVYNDDCDVRQKVVVADMKQRQMEIKAFKKRLAKTEL